ncbi:MAG: hypothetical protein C0200_03535 [Thermoproteota archaeon]|nr:MAG: hypothetical protein C0200_03535 [Candidatus Korarchaeota archaeon]
MEDPMKILVEGEELRNYPDNVRLLLAIALYEVTPYSWEKIAEILGFSPYVCLSLSVFGTVGNGIRHPPIQIYRRGGKR